MKIEIFKTGKHTDGAGRTRDWTEDDLYKIANSYNPQVHEAPVVIGHPKDNAPAYGWVEALNKKGGVLYATVKDLVPEFVDAVRKGRYKKRSINLYPDMSLRHIGFLGAVPPAVKGLADVAFKDEGGIEIEFEETPHPALSPVCVQRTGRHEGRGEKEGAIIGKEGKSMKFLEWLKKKASDEGVTLEDAPLSFSEAEIQQKITSAITEKEKEFSEKVASLEEARKKKEAELKAREDALRTKEEVLKQVQHDTKKKEVASFCEGLLKEGKLTPAMLKHGMGLINFFEQVGGIETTIEFTEGDVQKAQTPQEFMQSFLSALPKAIEFGEVAGRDKDMGSGDAGEKIAILTKKKMGANKDLTYNNAFAEVQKENPEITEEYAAEIRG